MCPDVRYDITCLNLQSADWRYQTEVDTQHIDHLLNIFKIDDLLKRLKKTSPDGLREALIICNYLWEQINAKSPQKTT